MLKFLRQTRLSAILLAVVVLLIFLHYVRILIPIENFFIRFFSPIQATVYSLGIKINSFYSSAPPSVNLTEENKKLQEQVNQLTVENSQLKTLLFQDQEIKNQTDFLATSGFSGITAKIIGKNPEPNLQSIILDKGRNDGVLANYPVIVGQGILVGKVLKVKDNSCEVVLINDSRSRIAALIQNENNSQGVVVGAHGLSLKMELIPKNELIEENNLVITSGLESSIPRGLVIGKVSRIEKEPNSFFQNAWLKPMVRIDNLVIVSILTNFKND